ncbi:hypothetical protein SK128_017705, partial [Halocaridina rubra]
TTIHNKMRPQQCTIIPNAASTTVLLLAVFIIAPPMSSAKRFDCQMFCRTTGFSGMVGGCRCSFTLFTAKRSTRDHHSVPEEAITSSEFEPMYAKIRDYMPFLRQINERHPSADENKDAAVVLGQMKASKDLKYVQGPPDHHPARLLVKPSVADDDDASVPYRSSRLSRSPSLLTVKRREFEQDLDNGDTSDYLRLPY